MAWQESKGHFLIFDSRCHIGWGYDSRQPGSDYLCEGRQGLGEQTRVVFQFTLDGRGEYSEKKKSWSVDPGWGLTVMHPSTYRYFLPPKAHWSFFWVIVQHPVVVKRFEELRKKEDPVQPWPIGSRALEAAATLFEALCRGQISNIWDFEERVFAWLWETERELYSRRYPENEQQQLLEKIRGAVLRRLDHPPSVSDLAVLHQMERTTFSRKFKAATGQSPAAFIAEVRLQESLKQLSAGAKLKEIAAATGFADATHFSKAFRQHFNISPGAYRSILGMRR